MKLGSVVVVTLANVILKFGYDQINISYGNALLKNSQIPVVNMPKTLKLCSTT